MKDMQNGNQTGEGSKSLDIQAEALTEQVQRLAAHVEDLAHVLDGTWGIHDENCEGTGTKEDIGVEERLGYIRDNLEKSMELLRGLRERLLRVMHAI